MITEQLWFAGTPQPTLASRMLRTWCLPRGLGSKRLYKFEPYPASRQEFEQHLTETQQMLTNKTKSNNNKQTKPATPKPTQPRRRRERYSLRPSAFSRSGPLPYISPYEGRGNIISANAIAQTESDRPDTPTDGVIQMMAVFNTGYGARVANLYEFVPNSAATAADVTTINAPYLQDASVTSSRALKSSMIIQNVTPNRLKRDGAYVLTTTQRFQIGGSVPTYSEANEIRKAIIANPNTKYISVDHPTEIANVPLNQADYEHYRNKSWYEDNLFIMSGATSEPRRPMTVTWVYFPYPVSTTPSELTPNQSYRVDIFTMRRCRHNVDSLLGAIAQPPPKGGSPNKDGQEAASLLGN